MDTSSWLKAGAQVKTMAQERLSKLQEWILKRCSANGICRSDVIEFFGKKYPRKYRNQKRYRTKIFENELERYFNEYLGRRCHFEERQGDFERYDWDQKRIVVEKRKYYVVKEKLISTNSEEVIITKSLKNMVKKGLLSQSKKWGDYYLTKKGSLLKANN